VEPAMAIVTRMRNAFFMRYVETSGGWGNLATVNLHLLNENSRARFRLQNVTAAKKQESEE
jgi:hypothetical protein